MREIKHGRLAGRTARDKDELPSSKKGWRCRLCVLLDNWTASVGGERS